MNCITNTSIDISIYVFCYNHQEYIRECLESILQQETSYTYEILIHDDASTDDTIEIINEYCLKYPIKIKKLVQSENITSKFKNVRDMLLPITKGKYIAYCDGDDYWLDSKKLEIQVSFLESNPTYVLCHHDVQKVTEDGGVIDDEMKWLCRCDSTSNELKTIETGIIMHGTLVHRNLHELLPPEYCLIPNGDNFTPILLSSHGLSKYIPSIKPLAYRQHKNSEFSSLDHQGMVSVHMRSYLLISAYFIRIGDFDAAKRFISNRLKFWTDIFLDEHH